MIVKKQRRNIEIESDITLQSDIKILGIMFSEDLSWNGHVDKIVKKANQSMYIIRRLKAILSKQQLAQIYNTVILGALEYNSPLLVGINNKNNEKLERIGRRCHRIICGSDCDCDLFENLRERRIRQALKKFKKMTNPDHILHHLLPRRLPRTNHFAIPFMTTQRRVNSFIPYCSILFNNSLTRSS